MAFVTRLVAAFVAVALVVTSPVAARQSTMAALYADHQAGRINRLRETFATSQDLRVARLEIFQAVREWRTRWTPSQVAFLFDLTIVGFQRGWEDAPALLAATRDWVVTRGDRPGVSAADDAFEITFHRAAVSLLVGLGFQRIEAADAYITALGRRVSDGLASGPPDGRLRDGRLSLMAGQLLELKTAPAYRGDGERATTRSWTIRGDEGERRRRAEQALVLYSRAMLHTETAAEAATRRAFLLHRLGRHDQALREAGVAESSADPVVAYWAQLARGRTLEALERAAEAGAAYERAAAIMPAAQTPAVALASLWQRGGRPEDAVRWAARARAGSADAADPWWDYWLGERRFLGERVVQLRAAKP